MECDERNREVRKWTFRQFSQEVLIQRKKLELMIK
jgi:hypothetical protein